MTLPIPKGVPSPLSLGTLVGAPSGMSRLVPQHELPDTNAWTIVDCNLNDPGFVHRRGPLAETTSSSRATSRAVGIARCQDPAGTEQVLVFSAKTGSSASEYYGFDNTAITASSYPYNFSVSPYELFDSKDALLGGAFVGSASSYDGTPTNSALSLWRGASKDDASSVAITGTTAQGGTTIVVTSAIASCCSGQFVFDHSSGKLVGSIKSISGSTITLLHPALVSTTTSIDVKALRGLNPRVSVGRITTSTTSAIVNGGLTKFSAQGLGSGSWDLFTPDYTYIGTVSSVASNAQLTLTGNAAVALVNAPYLAIHQDGSYSQLSPAMGWMNAAFAGHQFFAKGNLVAFSDLTDPEALDLTLDGNTFTVSPDPIRALIPGLNYLVIVTETEAYAIQGAIGTTPDKWRPERISDDGTICGMTGVTYLGGCIWAGKRGIWYYDGTQVQNVVNDLDGDYRLFVAPFSSASSRAYSAICNDHLLVFVESGATGVFQRTKDQTATDITRPTFVINLSTGATNLWENVEFRGSIQPPDRLGRGTCLLPITTTESAAHKVRVINGDTLFTHTGQDAYICEGAPQQGPVFYVETKKYDMGDSQRLKSFRMILLNYLSVGGNLLIDTVAHLNQTGVEQTSQFLAATAYLDKRIRIDVRSQYMSLRFNESSISGDPTGTHSAASITRVSLASWALGFKWKRPGRV